MSGDLFKPIIKAGTHLATSKDGHALGALLDNVTNQVVGQAKWIKLAQQSGNGKSGLGRGIGLGVAGGILGSIVVYENMDRIKSWWTDKAAPRLLAGALWLADIDPEELRSASEATEVIGPVSTEAFTSEVAVVVEDSGQDMSAEEAEKRLLLVFIAAAIISEQLRALKNANIKDSDLAALQGAMSKLTTKEVIQRLNAILASDSTVLDADTQAAFVKVFGGGFKEGDTYQPLTLDRVQDALRRLPDNEDDGDFGSALAPVS